MKLLFTRVAEMSRKQRERYISRFSTLLYYYNINNNTKTTRILSSRSLATILNLPSAGHFFLKLCSNMIFGE